MSTSSHHTTNPFSLDRPGARIPSNSGSSSSSWHDTNTRWSNNNTNDDPADMDQLFTSDMRDRQARGKDPYLAETSSRRGGVRGMAVGVHGMGGIRHMTGGSAVAPSSRHPKEPFQKTERRDWAETVLDNPELLLMYAQSSGDTLPATRLRFKRIMCGLEEDDDEGEVTVSDLPRGQYQHYQTQQPRFTSSSAQPKSGRGGGSSVSSGGR